MRVELVLSAIDRASGAIRAVEGGLGRLASMQEKLAGLRDSARSDVLDKVGAAAATLAPVIKAHKVFADFEDKLTDVGLKGELSGEKLKAFGREMEGLAPKVNRAVGDLLTGVERLVEGGMKFDAARQIIAPLARTSVATKATLDDLGKSAVTLVNNMKVLPQDIPKALDIMAQAGKEGQFELKGMAQYFPRLGALYAAMGQTGTKAVADIAAVLQIIRGQTGRDETAVAALEDILNKMTLGPAKKKFEELGINVSDVMEKAQKAGTVFETMFEVLNKATGGNADKLKDIFSDKQALAGARALLQEYQKFLDIRKKALGATGVVDQDFATRMGLEVEKLQALQVALDGFWRAFGMAAAPLITPIITKLTEWLQILTRLVAENPEIVQWVIGLSAALAGFGAVMAIIKLGALIFASSLATVAGILRVLLFPLRLLMAIGAGIFSGLIAGVSGAVAAFGGWAVVLAGLGRLLFAPFALAARGVMMLGAAMLATPVGWIIAGIMAIAGAAYLIYQNWSKIGPWLSGVWNSIAEAMSNGLSNLGTWFSGLGAKIAGWLSAGWQSVTAWFANLSWPSLPDMGDLTAPLRTAWSSLTSTLSTAWQSVTAWFANLSWPDVPEFKVPFAETIGGLFSGALTAAETGWNKIKSFFSSLSLPSLPSFGGMFGGAAPTADAPQKVAATAEQANAARAAVEAIAPAASTAVSAATSIFSGISFFSQGQAMMETLASGIRAGAASAVAAARATVQQIRDHLPHSPAKTGPLSDLDRVQFGQTLAEAITRGQPVAWRAAQATALGMAAALPGAFATPAFAASPLNGPAYEQTASMPARPGVGVNAGASAGAGTVSVSAPISITIHVQGGDPEDLVRKIREQAYEVAEIVRREIERREAVQH